MPETNNPNIHRYVVPTGNHQVAISNLEPGDQDEFWTRLDSQLLTYDVSFDTQGVGSAPVTQTVDLGKPALKPEDPIAEGYTFEGWYLDAECTTPYNFDTPVTQALTLYAKWTKVEVPQPVSPTQPATTNPPDNTTLAVTGDNSTLPITAALCAVLSSLAVGAIARKRHQTSES